MFFPYFTSLLIGTQIGKGIERTNTSYYQHTDRIIKLESKLKQYEHLFSKINGE